MDLSDYTNILDENVKLVKINPDLQQTIFKSSVYKVFKDYCDKYGIKKIIVSLSGGVDSMVIAYCAIHYGVEVIGGHMNYGNRDETGREQEFLEGWCKLYGIKFELLTFGGMRRGSDKRDEYERETRRMRYDFYGDLVEKYGATGVFLGHHSNDVAENTFCNVVHGRNLMDLSVIRGMSEVMGVRIYRPFRDIFKRGIMDFAVNYGVPYFRDTTPDWSNRGKLRRQIFPLIEQTFEEKFQKKLYETAVQSDELSSIIMDMVVKPFVGQCRSYGAGVVMKVGEMERRQGMIFWMLIFKELMHGRGESMPKQNVVDVMVGRLNIGKDFKMDFKKGMRLFYRDGEMYIIEEELERFWRGLKGRYVDWEDKFRVIDGEVSLEEVFFGRVIWGEGVLVVNPDGAVGRKLGRIRNPVGKWEMYLE